jgi:hypothetical protein
MEWTSGKLQKTIFKEKHVEKMEAELKELIEKAATKKDVTVRGSKGAGRKNRDREREQLKKEAVKALRA